MQLFSDIVKDLSKSKLDLSQDLSFNFAVNQNFSVLTGQNSDYQIEINYPSLNSSDWTQKTSFFKIFYWFIYGLLFAGNN